MLIVTATILARSPAGPGAPRLSIGDVDSVLDGDLDGLMHAWLVWKKTGKTAGDATKDDGDD